METEKRDDVLIRKIVYINEKGNVSKFVVKVAKNKAKVIYYEKGKHVFTEEYNILEPSVRKYFLQVYSGIVKDYELACAKRVTDK